MAVIRMNQVSFHYPEQDVLLFKEVSVEINCEWKSGVIARNGRGKTTLLKLIHQCLDVSQGDLNKEIETNLFPLEVVNQKKPVLEVIKNYLGPYNVCEKIMNDFINGDECEARYLEALEIYLSLDGYNLEQTIKKDCFRLKLDDEILTRPYETLSGGEQTKVQILMLFLKPNAFVLLDEPTNHLDVEGIKILSNYLASKAGFLIVSHHREFLDACIDHVVAIENQKLLITQGTYSTYANDYNLKKEFEQKQRHKIEKDVKRLEIAARERRDWSNAKEKEKVGAGDKGFVSHRAAKLMKRALSVERRITEQLEEKKSLLQYNEHHPYLIIKQAHVPKVLLKVSHLNVSYDKRPILKDISFNLEAGERLAIIGPNGCGKTTLIKSLLGQISIESGLIKYDSRVKIAYVSQFPLYSSGDLREILDKEGLEESRFRSILGSLSCHREIFERDLSTFSLGEQKKVEIARSLYHETQLLIWDEPLNGLDILTRQAIEQAILDTNVTMIFIEHDQTFIDTIATKKIDLDVNGNTLK